MCHLVFLCANEGCISLLLLRSRCNNFINVKDWVKGLLGKPMYTSIHHSLTNNLVFHLCQIYESSLRPPSGSKNQWWQLISRNPYWNNQKSDCVTSQIENKHQSMKIHFILSPVPKRWTIEINALHIITL